MAKGASADVSSDPPVKTQTIIVSVPNKDFSTPLVKSYRPIFEIPEEFPDTAAVFNVIPKECFVKSYTKSFAYLAFSLTVCASMAYAAWTFFPRPSAHPTWISVLLWSVYAFWQGAAATGLWVIAHECGHNAFCDNAYLQDTVGYILHSALLVPYFSWQRSHAVHHSRTNHMEEGETHVPNKANEPGGLAQLKLAEFLGDDAFAILNLFNHLVIGWPAYLTVGATGGPIRGTTSHFIPTSDLLFPGSWKAKVWFSDVGVITTIVALFYWAKAAGSWWPVIALYLGPYLWVNMWLVLYTWLQHTDVDIPHYGSDEWTWLKGAFCTVDRPYLQPFDFLHHKIGSTHVAHHLYSRIPHYNARKATDAIKAAFPQYYLYDPTPVHIAMFRVAKNCVAALKQGNKWWYVNKVVEKNVD